MRVSSYVATYQTNRLSRATQLLTLLNGQSTGPKSDDSVPWEPGPSSADQFGVTTSASEDVASATPNPRNLTPNRTTGKQA